MSAGDVRLDAVLQAMQHSVAGLPPEDREALLSPSAGVILRGRRIEEAVLSPLARELRTEFRWVYPECWLGRKDRPPMAVLHLGAVAHDEHRGDFAALRLLARWRAPVKVMLTGTFRDPSRVEREWSQLLAQHWREWPESPETRYAFLSPTRDARCSTLEMSCSVIASDGRVLRPFASLENTTGRVA